MNNEKNFFRVNSKSSDLKISLFDCWMLRILDLKTFCLELLLIFIRNTIFMAIAKWYLKDCEWNLIFRQRTIYQLTHKKLSINYWRDCDHKLKCLKLNNKRNFNVFARAGEKNSGKIQKHNFSNSKFIFRKLYKTQANRSHKSFTATTLKDAKRFCIISSQNFLSN